MIGCLVFSHASFQPCCLLKHPMRAQAAAQQPLSDEVVTANAHPPVDGEAAAPTSTASQQPKQSLLAAAAKTRKTQPVETEQEKQLREEQQIMADLQRKQALRSAMENAQVEWLHAQHYLSSAAPPSLLRRTFEVHVTLMGTFCSVCQPETTDEDAFSQTRAVWDLIDCIA